MVTAVKADYGYEKTEAAGRLVLRVRRQDSVLRLRRMVGLVVLFGLAMWIAIIMDDHYAWRTTYTWKTGIVAVLVIGFFAFKPKRPGFTTIEMGPDDLTVAGKRFSKSDIRNVVVQAPAGGVLSANSAAALSAKMDLAELSASQQYAVAFDYGIGTICLVERLTAPQAERVGSEVAGWLAA